MIYVVFLGLFYFWWANLVSFHAFRTTDCKETSPQPSTSGTVKEK